MKNYSRQREEIIKVIKNSYTHPTAEEIYMIVKAKDPAVSRSTVYRNLNLLVENKMINKISMKIGPDRFDYLREKHNHAVCVKCGVVFDLNCNQNFELEYEKLKEETVKQTGIELIDTGIILEGICSSCKN